MSTEVIQALEEQVGCYRRLAKLSELQHMHVQSNSSEGLLNVLKSRQVVVDRILELERQVAPIQREWSVYSATLDTISRDRTVAMLAEKRSLSEQITRADQNDALVLQQRKLNVGKEIRQTGAARQVNRNYAVAAYGRRPSRMDVQR